MSNPIPGWYPDPTVPGQQRYWDGMQWTENVAPLAPPVPPPGYPPAPPPGYAPTPPPYAGYGVPGYAPGYGVPQMGTPYAHWGLRLGAYLLDALIFAPFYIAAVVVAGTSTTTTYDVYGNATDSMSTSGGVTVAILYVIAAALGIWNTCYRQGRTGYSVGKQIVGIKLIKEATAQPLGAWPAFGRSLLHILDAAPFYLGFLWPIWDSKKQTFADKIMKSVVVVQPRPKN